MELVSLELDKYAESIGEHFEELEIPIKRVKFSKKGLGYFKKTKICDIINEALGDSLERKLVLYGYGGYHHFTYGLCKHADRISEAYAYVHFDHHDDSCVRTNRHLLGCGAFVVDILEDTHASAVLYMGSYSLNHRIPGKHNLGIVEIDFEKERYFEKLEQKLAKLPEEVYLSFDLDVMPRSVIHTDYNQGSLKQEELMRCIALIKNTKHIIGADVLGYTGVADEPGKEIYAKIVESLLEA